MNELDAINKVPIGVADMILDLLASRDDAQLSVAALCRAATFFGIKEASVRVALTRLVRTSKIRSTARGVYRLEVSSNLSGDVRSWLAKEQRALPWKQDWVGVCDAMVSRTERVILRRHERALALRGFKLFTNGLHLRPNNLVGGAVNLREELHSLGLAEKALVIGVNNLSDLDSQRAHKLWDVETLLEHYQIVLDKLSSSKQGLSGLEEQQAATESLLIGRQTIRCIIYDPLLPEEIMSGALRHRLIEQMKAYQMMAKPLWNRLLA